MFVGDFKSVQYLLVYFFQVFNSMWCDFFRYAIAYFAAYLHAFNMPHCMQRGRVCSRCVANNGLYLFTVVDNLI